MDCVGRVEVNFHNKIIIGQLESAFDLATSTTFLFLFLMVATSTTSELVKNLGNFYSVGWVWTSMCVTMSL